MPSTVPLLPPPSTPFRELTRSQQLEILREQLRRATQLVERSDRLAKDAEALAQQLVEGPETASRHALRARELITEAERELGRSTPAAAGAAALDDDIRLRNALLQRQLLAQARVARRDSRRFRFTVARRLAELEEQG